MSFFDPGTGRFYSDNVQPVVIFANGARGMSQIDQAGTGFPDGYPRTDGLVGYGTVNPPWSSDAGNKPLGNYNMSGDPLAQNWLYNNGTIGMAQKTPKGGMVRNWRRRDFPVLQTPESSDSFRQWQARRWESKPQIISSPPVVNMPASGGLRRFTKRELQSIM